METLTWKRVHKYRWQCNEKPSVSISAALCQGVPVYTLWQGDSALQYELDAELLRQVAKKL